VSNSNERGIQAVRFIKNFIDEHNLEGAAQVLPGLDPDPGDRSEKW